MTDGSRGLGGAADAGRQSRLSRGRAARRTDRSPSFQAAGTPTVYRGDRLPADVRGNVFVTEPAGNLVRRYVVEGGRRRPAHRDQRASARRVPHVDRRALPSGQPAVGRRRHALHRRHVPRRDPARAVPVGVPEEPDPRPRAGRADRPGPHLSRRARDHQARRAAGAVGEDARGAGAGARAPERLVARHRAAAARRARRRLGGAGAGRARRQRAAIARTRLHALCDARRPRRARRRRSSSARCATRRPKCVPPPSASPSRGWPRRAIPCRPPCGALAGRSRAARPLAARRVAGGVPGRRRASSTPRSCSRATGAIPFVVDGAVSSLTGLEHRALAQLLARPGAPDDALGAARRRGRARRRPGRGRRSLDADRRRAPAGGRAAGARARRRAGARRPRASACARRAG